MDIQTLKPFCCEDTDKEGICTPYSWGEFTFATNGHMQIRVPRLAEVLENEKAPVIEFTELDPVGKHYLKEPATWLPVPAITIKPEICAVCDGTGKAAVCPECNGEQSVDLSTTFNSYGYHDCKTCDADGQISLFSIDGMKLRYPWIEEIREPCSFCSFGKLWPMAGTVINGVKIKDHFLSLISVLPGVEIGVFSDPLEVVRFRFDGGDGLIMPMRQ